MNHVKALLATGDPWARETPPDDTLRARLRATVLDTHHVRVNAPGRRSALRVALATAATIVLAGVVSGTRFWNAFDAPALAAVRFEVRLAEDTPAPGLREAPVGTEPRLVYLHDRVVVSNDDIVAANVIPGRDADRYGIEIRLSANGSERMRAATRGHIGRPMALLVDGLVATAPTVRSEIGDVGLLSGDYSREDAERLVRGIMLR